MKDYTRAVKMDEDSESDTDSQQRSHTSDKYHKRYAWKVHADKICHGDTDSDSDSQEAKQSLRSLNLNHVIERYFSKIFKSNGFSKTVSERLAEDRNDRTLHILLCEAIRMNDSARAGLLLQQFRASPRAESNPDPGLDIPLHLAVTTGNLELVKLLLESGASPGSALYEEKQPLHQLCDKRTWPLPDESTRLASARLLLRHGADPNAREAARGDSPLLLALRSGLRRLAGLLLEHGADRAHVNRHREGPLHLACAEALGPELLELLFQEGLPANEAPDENGCTALAHAVRALVNAGLCATAGAQQQQQQQQQQQPRDLCELGEPLRAVLFLLRRARISPNSPLDLRANRVLHLVCQSPIAPGCLGLLLDEGADPNARNADGRTSLHFAAERQPRALLELLLARGAQPGALTRRGQSVLHFAAANREPGALELLLRARCARVDAKDQDGDFTPLFNAVWAGRHENVRLLLDWGARPNERVINGQIALHVAVDQRRSRCVRLLLERGSELEVRDDHGNTPLSMCLRRMDTRGRSTSESDSEEEEEEEEEQQQQQQQRDRSQSPRFTRQKVHQQLVKAAAVRLANGAELSAASLRILEGPRLGRYYTSCVEEVALMRQARLLDGLSFFDLLTGSRRKLLAYLRNEALREAFESSGYEARFPLYGCDLGRLYRASAERLKYTELAAGTLVLLVRRIDPAWANVHLPYLVVERILEYLNYVDLKTLAAMNQCVALDCFEHYN